MRAAITITLLTLTLYLNAQPKCIDSLNNVLENVLAKDQELRKQLDSISNKFGDGSKELNEYWQKINFTDSLNLLIVKSILDTYGWLHGKVVTAKAKDAIFLVIQHSNLSVQQQYIKLLKKAAAKESALLIDFAYLFDRILMQLGKFQHYGTQLFSSNNGNMVLYPIKDELNVNSRRRKVGLNSIQEYCSQIHLVYNQPINDLLKHKKIIRFTVVDSLQNRVPDVQVSIAHLLDTAITNKEGQCELIVSNKATKIFFTKGNKTWYFHLPKNKDVYDFVYMLK
jgi:hypothetical protein